MSVLYHLPLPFHLRPSSSAASVDRPLIPPLRARRFREHAHVLLQCGDEIGNDLERDDDLRADGRAHDVIGFGVLDVAFG